MIRQMANRFTFLISLTSAPESAMLARMSYPGGKNGAGVYQRIISLMPPHDIYIEPFLGGGAVMRLKRPARLNIGTDLAASAIAAMDAPYTKNGEASSFRFQCRDGIEFLKSYLFSGGELVYCDPPYLAETRTDRRLYEHEMSDVDHRRLLRVAIALPCMVMISGYESTMYKKLLAGWNHICYQSMTRGGYPMTEWLWFNFPAPIALHDYRYLGEGFRERERIKRKKRRWVARLENMPTLERQALLSAIADSGISGEKIQVIARNSN